MTMIMMMIMYWMCGTWRLAHSAPRPWSLATVITPRIEFALTKFIHEHFKPQWLGKSSKKNRIFYGQADRKGGGSTPPGLTVAFVKILGLKTHWIWFLDTQNTFYLMVKGLKNAYLMHFPSLHSWFRCSVCFYLKCSSSHNQRVIQRVKKHFFVKICFKSSTIKNRSQMYTSEKNTKQLTVRGGGGSTLTVSLTVKYPGFFLTTSLRRHMNILLLKVIWSKSLCINDHW